MKLLIGSYSIYFGDAWFTYDCFSNGLNGPVRLCAGQVNLPSGFSHFIMTLFVPNNPLLVPLEKSDLVMSQLEEVHFKTARLSLTLVHCSNPGT